MTPRAAHPVTPDELVRHVDLHVLRRLEGRFDGSRLSRHQGSGSVFADLRELAPDDDVRHIDWNVTARMDRPFVREHIEEREITGWFVVDLSGSMSFGSTSRSKADCGIELVAALGSLLIAGRDRVGAIVYSSGTAEVIAPGTGRGQLLRVLETLLRHARTASGSSQRSQEPARDRLADNEAADRGHVIAGMADLATVVELAQRSIGRRSLVVVVSDFLDEQGWAQPMRLLNLRHDLLAIRIVDPHERALPDVGSLVIEDLETGRQVTVDTGDPGFRARYARLFDERERNRRETLVAAGIDLHVVDTDGDPVDVLRRVALRRPSPPPASVDATPAQ